MKNKKDFERAKYDLAFFGQLVLGEDLHAHQIEMLSLMHNPINSKDKTHLVGMLPRQTGLTTVFAIAAAHHAIFGADSVTGVLNATALMAENFMQNVLKFISAAEDYFQTKFKMVIEKYSVANQNGAKIISLSSKADSLRGVSFKNVYVDNAYVEFLKPDWLAALMERSDVRIFGFSSGFSPSVQIIRNTLKRKGERVREITARVDDVFGKDAIQQFERSLGEHMFIKEILCGDLADPNTMARYYRGEMQ